MENKELDKIYHQADPTDTPNKGITWRVGLLALCFSVCVWLIIFKIVLFCVDSFK